MTNNQQLAAITAEEHVALIADCKSDIDFLTTEINKFTAKKVPPSVMARMLSQLKRQQMALAALTQPASQAFKLPETISVRTAMVALDDAAAITTIAQSYKMAWNACIAETKRLNAPHTAQIEPICATGGAEWVKVPRKLTAENGAKSALIGEFKEEYSVGCPECFGDEECETCDGSGRIHVEVPVSWTTIKDVWGKAIEHFDEAAPEA